MNTHTQINKLRNKRKLSLPQWFNFVQHVSVLQLSSCPFDQRSTSQRSTVHLFVSVVWIAQVSVFHHFTNVVRYVISIEVDNSVDEVITDNDTTDGFPETSENEVKTKNSPKRIKKLTNQWHFHPKVNKYSQGPI